MGREEKGEELRREPREEKMGRGVRSSEPTLMKRGWGTLKYVVLWSNKEDPRAQARMPVPQGKPKTQVENRTWGTRAEG